MELAESGAIILAASFLVGLFAVIFIGTSVETEVYARDCPFLQHGQVDNELVKFLPPVLRTYLHDEKTFTNKVTADIANLFFKIAFNLNINTFFLGGLCLLYKNATQRYEKILYKRPSACILIFQMYFPHPNVAPDTGNRQTL